MKIQILHFSISLLLSFSLFTPHLFASATEFSSDARNVIIQTAVRTNDWNTPVKRLVAELTQHSEDGAAHSDWSSTLHLVRVMEWLGTNEVVFSERAQRQQQNTNAPQDIYGTADRQPRNQLVAQRIKPQTLVALLKNTALVDSLAVTAQDTDYFPGVFSVLADLQEHDPDQMENYANLAVALAVVYDVNCPVYWPHPQVKRADLTTFQWANWVPLFEYFFQQNEDQRLLIGDIKVQPANVLKYMVDAPVTMDEFEWANKNVTCQRREFAAAYFLVPYDNTRWTSTARQYVWAGGNYTLANIEKKGGICVDQAYFACISAKARGLPTLLFSGVGGDAYHAWFGYLERDYTWNMNGGRYENEQFITGTALDPQTWQPVTDHQVAYETRQITSTDEFVFSQDLLMLANMEEIGGLADTKLQAVRLQFDQQAQKVCPDNFDAWVCQIPLLKQMKSPDLKPFLQDMLQQFQGNPDLKDSIQNELLAASKMDGDTTTQDNVESDMTNSHVGRLDVALRNTSVELLTNLDHATDDASMADVLQSYKTNVYKYSAGSSAAPTGLIFEQLVKPFVGKLIAADKKDEAKTCLVFAEKTLPILTGSQMDDYFKEVDKLLGIKREVN